MSGGYNWAEDLPYGEVLEQKVIKKLAKKHKLRKMPGYHKEFDLICDDCGLTIECKRDRFTTGNMCFEVPLLVDSTADILVYEVMGKTYWGKLEDVRYWIEVAVDVGELKVRDCGENGNKGYVMPIEHTIAFMEPLWT